MAVRRFGDGWQADFYAGTERIRRIFPTKREAEAFIGKIKAEIREQKYFDVKREEFETFAELMEWFLQLPEIRRKRSYAKDAQRSRALIAFFGKLPPQRITPEQIERYIQQRRSTISQRGRPYKPATINRELAVFKTAFNKAYRNMKTQVNPARAISKLKGEEQRDRVLSEAEWQAYYDAAPEWFKPIALCAYTTAMRQGEILNLRWDRVDLKTGFIRLRPEDTKTSEGRSIPIDPRLEAVLRSLPRPIQRDGHVFTRNGWPITDIQPVHARTCQRAGIENFWFHDFRHTATTNWRRRGVDYLTIMKATGHKTLSMFQRYNAVTEADLRVLVDQKGNDSQKMVNEPSQ